MLDTEDCRVVDVLGFGAQGSCMQCDADITFDSEVVSKIGHKLSHFSYTHYVFYFYVDSVQPCAQRARARSVIRRWRCLSRATTLTCTTRRASSRPSLKSVRHVPNADMRVRMLTRLLLGSGSSKAAKKKAGW